MEQLNLFEVLYEKYHITHKIRLIELFGGIGSQSKALEVLEEQGKLPMGFEHYRLVEFDKFPVASYNAIHGTNFEPTDITKIHASDLGIVERDKYDYLCTYSFPCQDLSLSGKGRGMKKGSGTRSGLLWEVERLLDECGTELPHILMMENVPNVVGLKNIEDFKSWVRFLESKGYQCYYQILNAKDYGIPQNRQRCFMISILNSPSGEQYYYEFPKPIPLKLKLKDLIDNQVDEKYYLNKKMIDSISLNDKSELNQIKNKAVKETIENCDLESLEDTSFIDGFNRTVRKDDCAGTIDTGINFRNKQFLLIKNANKKGYLEAYEGDGVDISSRMESHRGTVQKGIAQTIKTAIEVGVVVKNGPKCIGGYGKKYNDDYQYAMQHRIYDDKIATSVTTAFNPYYKTGLTIRKLTPKEAWRLMGWSNDKDFKKAAAVNSNTQLYKQAGNSIVVNVLVAIFSQLL